VLRLGQKAFTISDAMSLKPENNFNVVLKKGIWKT
jgi:hypothetical protein